MAAVGLSVSLAAAACGPVAGAAAAAAMSLAKSTVHDSGMYGESAMNSIATSILSAFTYRAALVAFTVSHEWAHLAAGELKRSGASWISKENLMGNTALSTYASALVPLARLPANFQPNVVAPKDASAERLSFSAAAGFLYSLAAAVALTASLRSGEQAAAEQPVKLAAAVAAWTVALGSFCTDIVLGIARGSRIGRRLFCGNFGLVVSQAWAKTTDIDSILEAMIDITSGRGGQSGGIAHYLPTPSGNTGMRVRVRPGRRQIISRQLASALAVRLRLAKAARALTFRSFTPPADGPIDHVQVFQGHTRFATSSMPSVGESHPHQWSPETRVSMWRVDPATGKATNRSEPFAVYVTHNGDFDYLNVYGRDRTQREVGEWLTVILHSKCPARCDSVKVAGVIELFRTQGVWAHAFRFAFLTTLATHFEDTLSDGALGASARPGGREERPGDALRREYTSVAKTAALAAVAEKCFASVAAALPPLPYEQRNGGIPRLLEGHETELVDKLVQTLESPSCPVDIGRRVDHDALVNMVTAAVSAFLHNGLYESTKRFLSTAQGSFGLCVSCSLDVDRVALAAWNQPMSIGFAPTRNLVVYGSESNAVKVPLPGTRPDGTRLADGETAISHRLDIDNVDGEVIEVLFQKPPKSANSSPEDGVKEADWQTAEAFYPFLAQGCHLRLQAFNVRSQKAQDVSKFMADGRLTDLRNNPYVELEPGRANTMKKGAGLVENDIRDITRVVRNVHLGWDTPGSLNSASLSALSKMLKEIAMEGLDSRKSGRAGIDVLVTGTESSLWVGEQFASDLQNTFPHLRVTAISANKVIGVLGNARGAISATGFSFCRMTAKMDRTICLVLSHSGQTFPTLHATTILERACPGRVFVVTGTIDTKMAAAVGQRIAQSAPFGNRIFSTGSGWRSAEPASVSALAMHHLLTEMLLRLVKIFQTDKELSRLGEPPLGLRFCAQDLEDLETINKAFVERSVPTLTGTDHTGKDVPTEINGELLAMGKKWGWNILEAPVVWTMHATYILIAVIFGWALFRSLLQCYFRDTDRAPDAYGFHYKFIRPDWVAPDWKDEAQWKNAMYYVAGFLDVVLFIFFQTIFLLIIRFVQGRPVLARIKGKRTLVIADVPFVHQLLEVYVSKLFALSYAIAGIEVHGANAIDHFVHRFTHRVARGLMLAFGRPDGRLCSQTKCESWVLMALLQARCITNMGNGPEVVTIGHNPHVNDMMDHPITLPTQRNKLLCESVCDVNETDPMSRMAALRYAAEKDDQGVISITGDKSAPPEKQLPPIGAWRCCDAHHNVAMAQARLVAGSMLQKSAEAEVEASVRRGSVHGGNKSVHAGGRSVHAGGRSVHAGAASVRGGSVNATASPMARDAVLSSMHRSVLDVLESQAPLEEFIENRYLSVERYTAFLVLFHQMAKKVASFWPLSFDTSRSQSRLRVATTAAPVSAADLYNTWMEGAYMDEASVRGVPKNSRGSTPDNSVRVGAGGSSRPVLTAISSFSATVAMDRNFPSWSSLNTAATAGSFESPSVHGTASQPWPTLPAPPSLPNVGGAAAWKAGLEGSIHSIAELEVEEHPLPNADPWWKGPPPAALVGGGGSQQALARVGSGVAANPRTGAGSPPAPPIREEGAAAAAAAEEEKKGDGKIETDVKA